VNPTGRSLALALVATLLFAACTDGNGGNGNGATGETAPAPVGVTGASDQAATYEYVNAGLRVVMQLDGERGTLEVDNGTEHDVGRPGFYVLDATTGARTDGRVEAPATVRAGDTATFDVDLDGARIRDIGLLLLLLGRDNYGAFVRTG
jgi:hypothetical protein